jgi:uncharacterized RDD family membrane protein YckC
MHPLAARRCRAHLTDCVGYLGVAAAMVPLGGLVSATTELGRSPLYAHLVSVVPPAVATVLAARAESGEHRATWGKRRQGLVVGDVEGGRLTFPRALLRNTAKILVPWQLGHMTAVGAAFGGFERGDALTIGSSVAVYGVIALYAWGGLTGTGRAVPDRLAGTRVVAVAPATA